MSKIYNSIMAGLNEAIEDAGASQKKLKRTTVTIIPVKEYSASEIKSIRRSLSMSQRAFASYLGVSVKTVESWEAGINHPAGAASRLISMLETDHELVKKFPFVQMDSVS